MPTHKSTKSTTTHILRGKRERPGGSDDYYTFLSKYYKTPPAKRIKPKLKNLTLDTFGGLSWKKVQEILSQHNALRELNIEDSIYMRGEVPPLSPEQLSKISFNTFMGMSISELTSLFAKYDLDNNTSTRRTARVKEKFIDAIDDMISISMMSKNADLIKVAKLLNMILQARKVDHLSLLKFSQIIAKFPNLIIEAIKSNKTLQNKIEALPNFSKIFSTIDALNYDTVYAEFGCAAYLLAEYKEISLLATKEMNLSDFLKLFVDTQETMSKHNDSATTIASKLVNRKEFTAIIENHDESDSCVPVYLTSHSTAALIIVKLFKTKGEFMDMMVLDRETYGDPDVTKNILSHRDCRSYVQTLFNGEEDLTTSIQKCFPSCSQGIINYLEYLPDEYSSDEEEIEETSQARKTI